MAAWWWAVTTVKRRNEGSGSMAAWAVESGRKCTYFFFSPCRLQMKDGQESSTLVMAKGVAPRQPPRLQPVTLSGPWLSHPIPQSPRGAGWQLLQQAAPLSRVCNRCHRVSERTLVMYHPRNFSLMYFSIPSWRNLNVLKELQGGDAKWLLTGNYVLDKVVCGSLRCHRGHKLCHDDQ